MWYLINDIEEYDKVNMLKCIVDDLGDILKDYSLTP